MSNPTPEPPVDGSTTIVLEQTAPLPPLSRVPDWLVRTGSVAWFSIGIIAAVAIVYFGLAQVRALVSPLVVAAVMGMLFYPLVDRLAGVGVRRGLGAGLTLLGIVAITAGSIWLAIRGVIDQGSEITESLEQGWVQVQQWLQGLGVDLDSLSQLTSGLSGAGGGVGGLVQSTFSGVASFLIGLFIGTFLLFYLLKDWHVISNWLAGHIGLPKDLGAGLIEDATRAIRQYFYGLTLTSIPVAIILGLAFWLLDLPLAFTVALVTFVTSFIPYLGAIFSGAFAVLVALGAGGPVMALIVLVVVLVTQNVLQTLLLTKVTSDQLSLHPIVNLGSTIVGATLAGIIGATLSAPAVAMVIAARKRITGYGWATGSSDSAGHPPGDAVAAGQGGGRSGAAKGRAGRLRRGSRRGAD